VLWIGTSGAAVGIGAGIAILFLTRKKSTASSLERDFSQTTFVFSGNLKQTSVLDAIQFLEIGRRQGILHIYCGRRKGYLIFVEGKVIDAFYRNMTGREAALTLLDLSEGDFYFEPKKIVQPRLISDSILDLAFELNARKQ
jgi:hypothetical protein